MEAAAVDLLFRDVAQVREQLAAERAAREALEARLANETAARAEAVAQLAAVTAEREAHRTSADASLLARVDAEVAARHALAREHAAEVAARHVLEREHAATRAEAEALRAQLADASRAHGAAVADLDARVGRLAADQPAALVALAERLDDRVTRETADLRAQVACLAVCEEQWPMAGGRGGLAGESLYTAPNGTVVQASAPVHNNSNYYRMEYMFCAPTAIDHCDYWLCTTRGAARVTICITPPEPIDFSRLRVWPRYGSLARHADRGPRGFELYVTFADGEERAVTAGEVATIDYAMFDYATFNPVPGRLVRSVTLTVHGDGPGNRWISFSEVQLFRRVPLAGAAAGPGAAAAAAAPRAAAAERGARRIGH